MTSCLHKLVRVCLAVISLTAFSHRIFKRGTILTENISRENIRQCSIFFCRCPYLFTFLPFSQFYWHIRLKSTAYFFLTHLVCARTITSSYDMMWEAILTHVLKLSRIWQMGFTLCRLLPLLLRRHCKHFDCDRFACLNHRTHRQTYYRRYPHSMLSITFGYPSVCPVDPLHQRHAARLLLSALRAPRASYRSI